MIDTHVHLASIDSERYPTRPDRVINSKALDGSVERVGELFDEAGVERAVLVQAIGIYGYDNRYVVDAAATNRDRYRCVVALDMNGRDLSTDIGDVCASGSVDGVRLVGVADVQRIPAWMSDGRAQSVWQIASERGLKVVVTLWPEALPTLIPLAERFPEVKVTLDHCGFPDLSGGQSFRGAETLFGLAAVKSIHLKVSSLVLDSARRVGDPASFLDTLAARFGTERLCWGSDFKPDTDVPYGDRVELGRSAARHLSEQERRRFFSETAFSVWWK